MQTQLAGIVALVTGATRGVGKGIAEELAAAGARVYVTGRSFSTADEREPRPCGAGMCVPIRCDHRNDVETERAFARLLGDNGRLDILVNSAWGGYERMIEDGEFSWPLPFWQQPVWRWDAMFDGGVRAAFTCSRLAARQMHAQRHGLIVNLSYWAARKYLGNAIYGTAKCATDRLTRDMAQDLAAHDVTVVTLYPGLVRTEAVLASAEFLDLSNSESPQFCGRAIAHLYALPQRQRRSGSVIVAAELARELGFQDIDGRQPDPLTIDTA